MYHNDSVELFGCDIFAPNTETFRVFHKFADLNYKQIQHPYEIPYGDDFFDTIIADGVLEHVPNDSESLKELYRVLKTGGTLVISCLPNRYSYLENLAAILGLPHHLRAYSMSQARSILLHSGFVPFSTRYLQMMPSMSGLALLGTSKWLNVISSGLWGLNSFFEWLWPFNRLSSNLFLLARKVPGINWQKPSSFQNVARKAA